MTSALVRRQLALAGIALLGGLVAFAVGRSSDEGEGLVTVGPPSYRTRAIELEPGSKTACGRRLTERLRGVAHPVLPCGARLVVAHGEREARVRVVERRALPPGNGLGLTPALAEELGLEGSGIVRWRFAPVG